MKYIFGIYGVYNKQQKYKQRIKRSLGLLVVNLIIVEMKSDNELANSIPVYFKSVKTGKFVLEKTKQTDQKKTDYKSYLWRVSNSVPSTNRVNELSITPRQQN